MSGKSIEELYTDNGGDDETGLTQKQVYIVLVEHGKNPCPGLHIDAYWRDKGKPDDELASLAEVEEINKIVGDPREELEKAFSVFDKDGNGLLDKAELTALLKATNQEFEFDDDFIKQTLQKGDKPKGENNEKDGMIDKDELINMLTDGLITLN